MSEFESLITGLSQGISGYLQQNQQAQQQMRLKQYESQLDINKEVTKQAAELSKGMGLEKYKVGLEDVLTPDMAEKALPGYGAKMVNDYNSQRPDNPLKLKDGLDFLDKAHKMLNPETTKSEDKQDKLEKEYADRLQKVVSFRSGGLGLQDSKVNQAIDLRTLLNQYYDPKTGDFNVPPAQHSELALGLARLVSPQGTVPIELEKQLRQSTGREALANALIYAGADPAQIGGPTQSVMKMFKDSIDRQGATAERLRDQYISGLKGLKPGSLSQDRADRLNKSQMVSSFNDLLNKSPDHSNHPTLVSHPVGKIAVISPKGVRGMIPAEQLDEAIKAGYKQAE